MRGGEGRGNKSSNYRETDDKQNPCPPPLMSGGFPALAAKLDKSAFTRVYLKLFPKAIIKYTPELIL